MDYSDLEKLGGCYTIYSQDFIDYIKQKKFKINYDIKLDGKEQPYNVEIATLGTKINAIKN